MFAGMYAYLPHVCMVPMEVRKGCCSPWNRSDRQPSYWYWVLILGFLYEYQVILASKPSLYLHLLLVCFFFPKQIRVRMITYLWVIFGKKRNQQDWLGNCCFIFIVYCGPLRNRNINSKPTLKWIEKMYYQYFMLSLYFFCNLKRRYWMRRI